MKNRPEQLPGRQHITYISECAMALFSKLDYEPGKWFDCIREAFRQHREYLTNCAEERKRIQIDNARIHCDDCGSPMTQLDVYNHVSLCHDCWHNKYVDSATVRGPITTSNHQIRPKPRLAKNHIVL